jgi:hypothetical protein
MANHRYFTGMNEAISARISGNTDYLHSGLLINLLPTLVNRGWGLTLFQNKSPKIKSELDESYRFDKCGYWLTSLLARNDL